MSESTRCLLEQYNWGERGGRREERKKSGNKKKNERNADGKTFSKNIVSAEERARRIKKKKKNTQGAQAGQKSCLVPSGGPIVTEGKGHRTKPATMKPDHDRSQAENRKGKSERRVNTWRAGKSKNRLTTV